MFFADVLPWSQKELSDSSIIQPFIPTSYTSYQGRSEACWRPWQILQMRPPWGKNISRRLVKFREKWVFIVWSFKSFPHFFPTMTKIFDYKNAFLAFNNAKSEITSSKLRLSVVSLSMLNCAKLCRRLQLIVVRK